MFDQVLQLIKEHIGSDPNASSAIPSEHSEAVHKEIASGITEGLKNNLSAGGIGTMLSSFTGGGNAAATGISETVASRLRGKFGLSEEAINSITAAIPGIVQKITNRS